VYKRKELELTAFRSAVIVDFIVGSVNLWVSWGVGSTSLKGGNVGTGSNYKFTTGITAKSALETRWVGGEVQKRFQGKRSEGYTKKM